MKYYKQETDYTCGIACIRMVLSTFGEEFECNDEKIIADKCQSSELYGTKPKQIVNFFNMLSKDIGAEIIENATIDDVRRDKADGYEIILKISVDVPHCVVYLGDSNNHIFYHDPFFGANQSKVLKKFLSEKTNYPFPRWRVEIEPLEKYYPNVDFSGVKEYVGKNQYIRIKKFNK